MILAFASNAMAQDELPDEQATFGLTQPDVIILMDVTGTMGKGPDGVDDTNVYASTPACTPDNINCNGSGCNDVKGFCSISSSKITTTCTYDCSRLGIAKRAIFSVLDYNKDGEITTADSDSLNVRVGAASFGKPTSSDLKSGYVKISSVDVSTDTYQKTVCGSKNKNNVCNAAKVKAGNCFTNPCVAGQSITLDPGTPLVGSLDAVLAEYATVNLKDNAKDCRQKFILLITDGADNLQCGSGVDCNDFDDLYCRRQLVLQAKKIANTDAGSTGSPKYKLFVIGFGMGMPDYLKNTLNWMAFWGDPANTEAANAAAAIKPSNLGTLGTCDPLSGDVLLDGQCQESAGGSKTVTKFYAETNDPGYQALSGHAYIADTASDFSAALQSAITAIAESTYSFTKASVQPVRDEDENFLYEASFNYISADPFWIGHLQRFGICTQQDVEAFAAGCSQKGDIKTNYDWDAGVVLRTTSGANRKIYTYKGGSQVVFKTPTDGGTITAADLAADNNISRDKIVDFIRGGDTAYDSTATVGGFLVDGWKLGDVFHASPITVSTPPAAFTDKWDTNATTSKGYYLHRADHPRTTADGTRLLLLGANDGQLHLIKTYDGSEVWSFIPPNLLPRLRYIAHDAHPVSSSTYMPGLARGHQYLVDGPVSSQEVWIDSTNAKTLCADANTCKGSAKSKEEWHTYFVFAEGRGGKETLWSSSTSCDSNFNPLWTSTYNNYCGYWAFDVTDTASISAQTSTPEFKWRIGGSAGLSQTEGRHLAQPWSKMYINRVRVNNKEKWVGFIGGGYSGSACSAATGQACTADKAPGKGFYVISMEDGSILWSATENATTLDKMNFDLAAPAVAIDRDGDGFRDVAYVADTGGNVWRFKFCTAAQDADPVDNPCTTANWQATLLFAAPSGVIRPIFTAVEVAKDNDGQYWVYFGTGDKTEPTADNTQERFYALKEDFTTTISGTSELTLLQASGTASYTDSETSKGWYIQFSGQSEKILGDPVVYDGVAYFTTYIPNNPSDPCDQNGTSYIYAVDYKTGAGLFELGAKGQELGGGLATGVIVSDGKVYVSKSAGTPHTMVVPPVPGSNTGKNSLIYWLDKRVQ